MSRRPYFDASIIRDELRSHGHYKDGYCQHVSRYSVVGMDGRNDWFRWHCRDCDKKHISSRSEKRMRYMKCSDCGTLHFVYKGFFSQDKETVPLTQDEVSVELHVAEFQYAPSEYEQVSTHYGSKETLEAKAKEDSYELLSPIRKV